MSDRRASGESGAVVVMVAIVLPVLLGLGAFALDTGNWYLRGQREQKAADAAVLAGAVYLPQDPTKAIQVARDLAARNGYADDADTTVTIAQQAKASQLRVTISQNRPNILGSVLGVGRTRIGRTAVSEFQAPVPMGSPANTFGNEPIGGKDTVRWSTAFPTDATQPMFWANVAGPQSPKHSGDANTAGTCGAGDDGCSGSTNTEYSPNGYFYTLRVPAAPAGAKLVVQAFDPAFVNVGDHCTTNLDNANKSSNPYVTDAAQRYVAGDGKFCTGDQAFTSALVTTSFLVRAPSSTPWDPLSFPVINTSTCNPLASQFAGYDVPLATPLKNNNDPVLQRLFRQWVPLCEITAPPAGDYLIQVRTNIRLGNDPAGPYDPTVTGSGHNRFALRAGFVRSDGSVTGAGIGIFAAQAMAIYANVTAAKTQFYLVRIPSGSGGRALALSFYDVGDADPGTLRVVAPADSGVTFSNCTGTGPRAGALTNCSILTNSTDFQGKWQRIRVPIPTGYTCNDGNPMGCWVRVEYAYSGGTADTTTWTASIEGDPVRLVE